MIEKREPDNKMKLQIESLSENESLSRVAVAAFVTRLDPTLEEIDDIRTSVSEAVTNAIIHGYSSEKGHIVEICCEIWKKERAIRIIVSDTGIGIENIDKAMEPLFTTKPEMDRSGMGFVFMEVFMDTLDVKSKPGLGTVVTMTKKLHHSVISE